MNKCLKCGSHVVFGYLPSSRKAKCTEALERGYYCTSCGIESFDVYKIAKRIKINNHGAGEIYSGH